LLGALEGPPCAWTITSTTPAPAGEVAVIEVSPVTENAAGLDPNVTPMIGENSEKFTPVMITLVPPMAGPVVGVIAVTTGSRVGKHLKRTDPGAFALLLAEINVKPCAGTMALLVVAIVPSSNWNNT
jgi:hypothetical protein